jgi:CBS domain-containing protein
VTPGPRMSLHGIRHLPVIDVVIEIAKRCTDLPDRRHAVVNRDGALLGIISYVDVLRAVAQAA